MKDKHSIKENNKELNRINNINNNMNSIIKDANSNRNSISGIIYKNLNQKNSLEFFSSLSKLCRNDKKPISKFKSYSSNSRQSNYIYIKYYSAVQKTLSKKYFFSRAEYDNNVIDNLIYNRNCHIVSAFKEYMIIDYVDEFLKRLYKINESTERIPKFANYYKNYLKFFCNPMFRDFKANSIIQGYGDNKAELYYNRNYGNKKKNNQNPNNEEIKIFNTTVKKNIDKNSLTQTQNTIRQDLLEVSMEGLEIFKPSIDRTSATNFISARETVSDNKNSKEIVEQNNNENNSTNLNIGDECNYNLNSFVDKCGANIKTAEESLLNLLSHLNTNNDMETPRDQKPGNYKLIRTSNRGNVRIVKKITKSNEDKIIKEFEEKIMKTTAPTEIIKSFVSGKFNNYDTNNQVEKNDNKIIISANSPPQKESMTLRISSSKDADKSNNFQNHVSGSQNPTQIINFKSPKGIKLNEFKNLKLTKGDNFKSSVPIHNLNSGVQPNHVKNVYSSEFLNVPSSSNNQTNTFALTISKHFNTINEKEKTEINCSNSNINSPLINLNKTVNKIPTQTTNNDDTSRNKQIKEEPLSKKIESYTKLTKQKQSLKTKNITDNKFKNNITLKKSFTNINTNQIDKIRTNFSSNNRLINSSSFNQNEMQNNNNNNASSINDIMKITLSLYMDKSSRNRLPPEIEQAATHQLIQSPGVAALFDVGRKPAVITKVDSINNFNININNQININDPQMNTFTNVFNQERCNSVINQKISTEINKNINTNLKTLLEKNKGLSRNKNQSLYKFPSSQAKSNTLQEEEDIFHSANKNSNNNKREVVSKSSNKRIYNSHNNVSGKNLINLVENKQLFYSTKNDVNPNNEPTNINDQKKSSNIKHSIDDYNTLSKKKSVQIKTNFKSPLKFQSELCTTRNKKFLSSNINTVLNPSQNDKKINKLKLSGNDVKKLVNNINQTGHTNQNLGNNLNLKSNAKLMNLYQTTSSISKKYFSSIKK